MITETLKKHLEKQEYRIVGKHSACKMCSWAKKDLTDKGECYKAKFYGIKSHLCCQMTPCLSCCNQCVFCWRDLTQLNKVEFKGEADDAKFIVDGCIEAQRELINGYPGNPKTNMKKWKAAQEPKHFAISLTGEPTMYPKINELISELHSRGKSTFIVTNGMFPEKIKNLTEPTQLYMSIDAPNEKLFLKIDKSLLKDSWKRLNESIEYFSKKKCRKALRITLIKDLNMTDEEGYKEIIRKAQPTFVEVKAYMHVGSSRQRLEIENMPRHEEVVEFSKKLEFDEYKIVNEQKESRVVLLAKTKNTLIDFEKSK